MGFDFGQDLATGGLLSTHGELADETDEDGWSRTHVQMLKDFLNKYVLYCVAFSCQFYCT
jgi:hypothetical protein